MSDDEENITIFDLLDLNTSINFKESYTPVSKEGRSIINEDDFFRSSSLDYFRSSSFSGVKFNESEKDKDNGDHKMTSKFHFSSRDFEILSCLGSGAYAEVFKAKHKVTNVIYSIKIIDKRNVEKENKAYQIFIENELLSYCNHPNIINLYGCYEEKDNVCLVEEYCPKGDLAEFIGHNAPLTKDEIQFLVAQIVSCLEYLANLQIIHRDIKPENFMIDAQFKLKLIDFGTATFKGKILDEDTYQFVEEDKYLYEFPGSETFNGLSTVKEERVSIEQRNESHSNIGGVLPKDIDSPFLKSGNHKHSEIIKKQKFVGTAEYMAPEIINNQLIGEYTDIWSLACIIFQMFTGNSPFRDKTEYLIFQKVLAMNYNKDKLSNIPKDASDLIFSLLKLKPSERLGYDKSNGFLFDELKHHPFFKVNKTYNINDVIKSLLKKSNNAIKKAEENKNNNKCIFEIKTLDSGIDSSSLSYSMNKESFSDISNSTDDTVIKTGMLKKQSPYFYYDLRKVILLSTPRVDYIDPESNQTKGTILLDKSCEAQLIKNNQFYLKTPKRTYSFMCKDKYDITPWVKAINKAIMKYGV